MAIVEIEATPRSEDGRDLRRPPPDAGKPAQGAEAHIDEVVTLRRESLGGVKHVSLDEASAIGQAGPLRQRASVGDRSA